MAAASLMTAGRPLNHFHNPAPFVFASNPSPPSPSSSPTDLSEYFRTWNANSSATVNNTDMSLPPPFQLLHQAQAGNGGYQQYNYQQAPPGPSGAAFGVDSGGQSGPLEVNLEADDLKPEMDSLAMGMPEISFPSLDFSGVAVVGIDPVVTGQSISRP
jgi:hypothetical protein